MQDRPRVGLKSERETPRASPPGAQKCGRRYSPNVSLCLFESLFRRQRSHKPVFAEPQNNTTGASGRSAPGDDDVGVEIDERRKASQPPP